MIKWRDWYNDYMEVDCTYLVHAHRSENEDRYFIGIFKGRLKDILYFKDAFDHEIQLYIVDYIYEVDYKIEFIPLNDIRELLFENYSSKDKKEDNTITGTIESIVRDRDKDRFICDIRAIENKSAYLNTDAIGVDTLFDYFKDGTKVKMNLYHDKDDIPVISDIENCDD